MPPRTTEKSPRPRVSDRTVVAVFDHRPLVQFQEPTSVVPATNMERERFERAATAAGEHPPRSAAAARRGMIASVSERGWKPQKESERPACGEIFLLTSPLIE